MAKGWDALNDRELLEFVAERLIGGEDLCLEIRNPRLPRLPGPKLIQLAAESHRSPWFIAVGPGLDEVYEKLRGMQDRPGLIALLVRTTEENEARIKEIGLERCETVRLGVDRLFWWSAAKEDQNAVDPVHH